MFRTHVAQPSKGSLVGPSNRDILFYRKAHRRDNARLSPDLRATGSPSDTPSRNVEVVIEKGARNSRCVYAGIDVAAPKTVVWDALSAYDELHTFIPGLKINQCLERKQDGAVLLQEGIQEIGFGLSFSARCILRVQEWPNGISRDLCTAPPREYDDDLERDFSETLCKFPMPRSEQLSGSTPFADISFHLVEGDFLEFRGLWRMHSQRLVDEMQQDSTRLSYSLFVRPKPWLPVGLLEGRIEREVRGNLSAVAKYAEQRLIQLDNET